MPALLVASEPPDETARVTRIGGRPLAPRGMEWPRCRTCSGRQQFLAQVRLADAGVPDAGDALLLLFQCNNDPGMCDEWDPDAGGNRALVVDGPALEVLDPNDAHALLDDVDGVELRPFAAGAAGASAYEKARSSTSARVLGQVGGEPDWIQADETPTCGCGRAMRFVVQLEEGGGGGINFGDVGCGYGFVCPVCRLAKFLWQCH